MAYHQQHDPYANAFPDYPPANNQAPNYAYPQQHAPQQQQRPQHDYSFDNQSSWDAKSTKSYQSSYAGSQAHLNPNSYDMHQVSVPPMPNLPYQAPAGNYPPQQRPGLMHQQSTGYSVAREKLMKRRSVRQVELQQGNLVLDMDVPTHIVPKNMDKTEEMSKLRYTAATCDPDDFMRQKYTLRPYLMGRRTELFIVMTMYNEDEVLFCRTMNAYVPYCCYRMREQWAQWKGVTPASSRTSRICAAGLSRRCGVRTDGRRWLCASCLMDATRSTSALSRCLPSYVYTVFYRWFVHEPVNTPADGVLPRGYRQGLNRRQGRDCAHLRVSAVPRPWTSVALTDIS